MQSALLTTVLALAAPLVSAATLPRDVVEVEARDTTVPVSYATAYLDISLKIADFGCSAAPNGSIVKEYEYFVDVLEDYYSIIATPWAADNKTACGQCVEVTYTNAAGEKRKVYGVTVDSTGGYFNFDQAGFAGLDGRASFDAGTLQATATTVDLQKCRRARQ
ncbi:putative allergenic cerato-platanin asp f13 [Diaporthe ampelina]|uniref:Putative allergenic cerato-platanin asp f13 n=1 Tax=Diaporthe ampelina TaxID=1214573 RepID=A0A0G2FWX1_9PEZI|nr:putative allergenic cerato-platanin asp f13 [Diaporthe ampelina]